MTLGGPNLGPDRRHAEAARASADELGRADIIERLRPQLDAVPGMQVFLQNPPTIRIGGQVSKSLYQYSMQSPDKEAALRRGAHAREGAGGRCPASRT